MSVADGIPRLKLAATPTPLEELSGALSGKRLWIKRDDQTGGAESGNKIRKLEFSFADALEQGADTIITCGGPQSNHCRAVALTGARLGLQVHLVQRANNALPVDGNLLMARLCGAEVHAYDPDFYQTNLPAILEEHRERLIAAGRKPYLIPSGASHEPGIWGYVTAFEEMAGQMAEKDLEIDAIVTAIGSTGTIAGLLVGAKLCGPDIPVYGFSVGAPEQLVHSEILRQSRDWGRRYGHDAGLSEADVNIYDHYIGEGYALASDAVYRTIGDMARTYGVLLDPVYTAKAFHGMKQEADNGVLKDKRNILFLHTGGVFGTFPHKANLSRALDL
jgi:D-cysteine desulfhydrase